MNKLKAGLWTMVLCVVGIIPGDVTAQVLGGQQAFSYLELPNSPHVTALGGLVPAGPLTDVNFTLQNPALLNPKVHNRLSLNYNLYYDHIGVANLQYAYHVPSLKTDFGLGLQYLNYGKFQGADIMGNPTGDIHASDYAVNLSASRQYLKHWRYGATMKFARSMLADRNASALLWDVGVVYDDTAHLWTLGIVAKNMGFMISKFNQDIPAEPLPFDLQIGISKRLKNVPLRVFVVGHHLYEWNVRYDNPADQGPKNIFGDQDDSQDEGSHFGDKLFRHINFGAELYIGKRIEVSLGYNHLHRQELGAGESKGMAGFSFGAGVNLNKFFVSYSRNWLATAGAFNQLGLTFQLNKLFGLGSKTEKWGWNAQY